MLQAVRSNLLTHLFRNPRICRLATVATESNITGTETNDEERPCDETHLDEFTKEFLKNRIEMSPFQKILLGAGSSIAALIDPRRCNNKMCMYLNYIMSYFILSDMT